MKKFIYYQKPKFKLYDIVLYFPYGENSDTHYVGKIILVHKNYVTAEVRSPLSGIRNFTIKGGFLQGTYQETKNRRPFIRIATEEEIKLEARKEAFDIISEYFCCSKSEDEMPDYMVCRIQNMIGKQNKLISMYESERI